MFSCEYCEISKKISFCRTPPVAASVLKDFCEWDAAHNLETDFYADDCSQRNFFAITTNLRLAPNWNQTRMVGIMEKLEQCMKSVKNRQ